MHKVDKCNKLRLSPYKWSFQQKVDKNSGVDLALHEPVATHSTQAYGADPTLALRRSPA